jgi:hypothetical protein
MMHDAGKHGFKTDQVPVPTYERQVSRARHQYGQRPTLQPQIFKIRIANHNEIKKYFYLITNFIFKHEIRLRIFCCRYHITYFNGIR